MRDHRHRILLQHEHAQEFFESALHPDLEELRRRDRFFEKIAQEISYFDDDGDLVAEIPDIDVRLLMGVEKQSKQLKDLRFDTSQIHKELLSATEASLDAIMKNFENYITMRSLADNDMSSVVWMEAHQQNGNVGCFFSCAAI